MLASRFSVTSAERGPPPESPVPAMTEREAAQVSIRACASASVIPSLISICRCWAHRMKYSVGVPSSLRSEEHTSELQSLMRISYAVFCLKKKNTEHNYCSLHIDNKHYHISL